MQLGTFCVYIQILLNVVATAFEMMSNYFFRYLVGCDNILAKLHTKHPELCDKVGGLLAMHIDDLRVFAPMWLSKTEEVREDRDHWATNITGDIYGKGWISEMYGYSFGAAEVSIIFPLTFNGQFESVVAISHCCFGCLRYFHYSLGLCCAYVTSLPNPGWSTTQN